MKIAVLGAGGYGTAVLRPITDNGHSAGLWDRNSALLQEISERGVNPRYPYLLDFTLPPSIRPVSNLHDAIAEAEAVVCAVSMGGLPDVYATMSEAWPSEKPLTLIGISKGITEDGQLPDALARAAFLHHDLRYVHLAGPAFAQDLIHRSPVGLVAASSHPDAIALCRTLFANDYCWVYSSNDLQGIEAAAAVRTILSVVFGGMAALSGVARSTKAFLFSRAQAEIARFGLAMGGKPETFAMDSPCAPATLGDLYLCDDPGSRNWQLGYKLASGLPLETALSELQGVAESVTNAAVIHRLAQRFRKGDPGWELPWCEAVYRVCHEGVSVEAVLEQIRARNARLKAP